MSSNIGDFDGAPPPVGSMKNITPGFNGSPLIGGSGTGVVRRVTPEQDRAHFNCPKLYQVFMADDGNFNAVSGELPKEQAAEALRMMTTHPEMSKQKLFMVEVSRRAIEANFSPMLIKPNPVIGD